VDGRGDGFAGDRWKGSAQGGTQVGRGRLNTGGQNNQGAGDDEEDQKIEIEELAAGARLGAVRAGKDKKKETRQEFFHTGSSG
jgi:hypothetical protein